MPMPLPHRRSRFSLPRREMLILCVVRLRVPLSAKANDSFTPPDYGLARYHLE
jgi:hypothetical protein